MLKRVIPLIDMLKKDRPWRWAEEEQAVCDKLKMVIATEPVLKLLDF